MALATPLSRSRRPSCQVCGLLHSSDPKLPSPSPPHPSLLVWARLFQKLGRVGGGTKGWVFFLAPTPPWVLGAESFLVSSLEQGTKPSPAWPQSGHSWECVSLDTGWCGGDVLSVCVCVTGLCLCVSGYVCVSGFVCFGVYLCLSLCLQTCVFKWVVGETQN